MSGLALRGVSVSFPTAAGPARAVDGVDLEVGPGEILGLVGESGSGKSATLRAILGLIRPPGQVAGSVLWDGRDLMRLPAAALRAVRGGEIATVFQEAATALNPVLPMAVQVEESLRAHTGLGRAARRRRAVELFEQVGVPDAARRLRDYPHQFSGGMRQRAMLAIALASQPRLLLADEPTTALDVTIQDQVLKLLLSLRRESGMGILFVTHDLGAVAALCDRVAVMYAGRVVETAPVAALFAGPRHPYTLGLLGAVPQPGAERQPLRTIEGLPPSSVALPPGCAFAPRCGFAVPACAVAPPALVEVGPGRSVACLQHAVVAGHG